jgi:hypothetical protein
MKIRRYRLAVSLQVNGVRTVLASAVPATAGDT